MTGRNAASASSFQEWGRTARWGCGPSRKKGAGPSSRTRPRRNSTACREARWAPVLADIVAPAEALPGKIIAYLQHDAALFTKSGLAQADKARSGLAKILILLRDHTGHDFSLYKNIAVYRRIERRMGVHQIEKIATYVRFLQENPQEVGLLFKELLIGVTELLPRPGRLGEIENRGHPGALERPGTWQALRAWVIGCATGEEAYSLAIVFKEALEQLKPAKAFTLQIFATDLDGDAIEKARDGRFPGQYWGGCFARAPAAILYQGRARLPGFEGNPGNGDLCAAEPDHGSAFHQDGPRELPEPADLPVAGSAERTFAAFSLQSESRRRSFAGQV